MADVNSPTDLLPDVAGVKSRVSWPAIVGGAMVALASYLVLALLGASITSLLAYENATDKTLTGAALIFALATVAISLFLGGWTASQLTVGENRQEAVIYGVLVWAVVTGISLYLVAVGVRATGYFAALGGSMVAQANNGQAPSLEDTAKKYGYTDAQIAEFKAKVPSGQQVRDAANDPTNQEKAKEYAAKSSWTALVAVLLSMAAAVGGALAGVGTQFRLFPVETGARRAVTVTSTSGGVRTAV